MRSYKFISVRLIWQFDFTLTDIHVNFTILHRHWMCCDLRILFYHHRNPHLPCFRLTDFMCIALTARPPLHHTCYSSATNTYFYYFAVDAGIAGGLLLPILTLKNPCSQWQHLFQVDKQLWRINITVCTLLPMSVGKALCPTPLQPCCFGWTF